MKKALGLLAAAALVLSVAAQANASYQTPTGECWDDPLGDANVVQAAADRLSPFSPIDAPSPLVPVSDSRGDFTQVCGSVVDGRVTATFTVPGDSRPAGVVTDRTFSMFVANIGSCASLTLEYLWGETDRGEAEVSAATDCESPSLISPASASVPGVTVAHEPSSGVFSVSVALEDVASTIDAISGEWYFGVGNWVEIDSARSSLRLDGPVRVDAVAIDELNFI